MLGNEQSSRRRYRAFLDETTSAATASRAARPIAGQERRRDLLLYWSWVAPHRGGLIGVFVLALIGIAGDMAWPVVSAYLIDDVILSPVLGTAEKGQRLALAGAGLTLVLGIKWALSWLQAMRMQLHSSKLASSLRRRLFRHVLRLPVGEISKLKTAGVLSRLSSDVDHTTELLQSALLGPAVAGLRLIVLLIILFSIDARIGSALALLIPLILLWHAKKFRQLRPIWRSIAEERQAILGRVEEAIGGVVVVRAFRRERGEERALALTNHSVVRKELLATNVSRALGTVWDFVVPLIQVALLCGGGYLIARGELTLGLLVAIQAFAFHVFEPLGHLGRFFDQVQHGLAAFDRISEVLQRPQDKPDPPAAVEAPSRMARIEFDSVCFGYRPDLQIIHDFNLELKAGSVVALVGRSGAGKTTISHLLARFHDPTSGSIRLNGVDLRNVKQQSYRRLVGVVPQEVFLFDGSVRDNIAYGRSDASAADVEAASRSANAHEFIVQLPHGYNTIIGERGFSLSGGQRQRIALARAFLLDPPILILDEATSSLDVESEQLIQTAMKELLVKRTTLIIAHRLSTLIHADEIVVIEQGRVVHRGTHEEIVRTPGPYLQMMQRQRQPDGSKTGQLPVRMF